MAGDLWFRGRKSITAFTPVVNAALGNPKAGPGKMLVYRVHSEPPTLENRNAADLPALLGFIGMQDERQMAYGDKITVFEVPKPDQLGHYDAMHGGQPRRSLAPY